MASSDAAANSGSEEAGDGKRGSGDPCRSMSPRRTSSIRCRSCDMNIRQPLKVTDAAMTEKDARQPDDMPKHLPATPSRSCCRFTIRKFGCSPCRPRKWLAPPPASKRRTAIMQHWLWPLYPQENSRAAARQVADAVDMVGQRRCAVATINAGKDLFRRRGCKNGCHRYEGYDKEPRFESLSASRSKD